MKVSLGVLLAVLATSPCLAQNKSTGSTNSPIQAFSNEDYVVVGATADEEAALREQIRIMNPKLPPARVIFVPHWKYLDDARIFQLHVPKDMSSAMFTHLASRTVFVDSDRYLGKEWLGHWIAHELGHLESNSASEGDAEKVAHRFRALLKAAGRNS